MRVRTPQELWQAVRGLPLVETVQALAQLPLVLERNVRQTNELIAASKEQLAALHEVSRLMLEQMRRMAETAERLAEVTPAMVEMAAVARRQMELTTEQLERTNQQLAEVIRISEPLERMGRRVQRFLDRRGGED